MIKNEDISKELILLSQKLRAVHDFNLDKLIKKINI